MTTKPNRLGPDWDPPRSGLQADAQAVAWTALHLAERLFGKGPALPGAVSRHAVALHVISGRLHRLDERECSEDLGCPNCHGDGYTTDAATPALKHHPAVTRARCRACAGTGLTTGRTLRRLELAAQEIAELYGLQVYHQGDCRGCALYLCAPANATAAKYDQGHAVTRLGR